MKELIAVKQTICIMLTIIFLFSISCQKKDVEIKIISSTKLSQHGSSRATAYMMSNKIITADNKIFVAWLDLPSDIQIKMYDIKLDKWSETVLLGQGTDNHAGPAITMDGNGFIHAVFGPHHNPFQYRVSKKPYDVSEWIKNESFGIAATYPSLICDEKNNLHIAYRCGEEPWRVLYQTKIKGQGWSEPLALVIAGVIDGYTHYGNRLVISGDGILHLGFHIYDEYSKRGKTIGYIKSEDKGKTWQNANSIIMQLPVDPNSDCFIEGDSSSDLRIGDLAVDSNGTPWITSFHNETSPRTTKLWHFDGNNWIAKNLLEITSVQYPECELLYCGLTFDREGIMYIPAIIQKNEGSTHWGDPSQEVILLFSSDGGKSFDILPISETDLKLPNWLINIERPFCPNKIDSPSLLYTHGDAGVMMTDGDATEVKFVRFEK
jgi:hypothetical protein